MKSKVERVTRDNWLRVSVRNWCKINLNVVVKDLVTRVKRVNDGWVYLDTVHRL